jgi:hypothetical protein
VPVWVRFRFCDYSFYYYGLVERRVESLSFAESVLVSFLNAYIFSDADLENGINPTLL